MSRENCWLLDCRKNVTSQFGEDGIIEKILSMLPKIDKWCVEFGAWDGVFCSNTHHLIKKRGYKGVLIEGDSGKFPALKETYKEYSDQILLNRFIEFEGLNSLDNILAETQIPRGFDVLSIDIDGNDYHIWKSLTGYEPKVVVIEFNMTIPMEMEAVQSKEKISDFGASLLSLHKLGLSKGYELVSVTDNNGIFVKKEFFSLFGIEDNSPQELWKPFETMYSTKVYQKYDGTLVLVGNDKLFWYTPALRVTQESIQIIPRFLRHFPANVSRMRRLIAKLFFTIFRSDLKYPIKDDKFAYTEQKYAHQLKE
jgi:hypothetical protein